MTRLAALTYPEVRSLLQKGAIGLWPIGSTEAHGPHLPLDTDVIIASEICRRVVPHLETQTGLAALVLPPLAFTLADCAAPFAGTITLPSETVLTYIRDVILGAAAQGFKLVCLVNAHLEPDHRHILRNAVAAAAEHGAPVALADPADRRWVCSMSPEFQSGACHAGRYESSLVMAARPEAVRDSIRARLDALQVDILARLRAGARTFSEMGAQDGYFGSPAEATVEEGEATYQTLTEIVCAIVKEALS